MTHEFFSARKAAIESGPMSSILQVVDTNTKTKNVAGLGDIPEVKESTGTVNLKTIGTHSYNVTVKKWDIGVAMDGADVRNHILGGELVRKAGQLGAAFPQHWARYLTETKLPAFEGTSITCFDGQYPYDDDHPIDGGTQSNDITYDVSSTSSITLSEAGGILDDQIEQLMGLRTDTGAYLNSSPSNLTLITSLSHARTYSRLISPGTSIYYDGSGAVSNVYAGMQVNVLGNVHTADTKIHLIDSSGERGKPFGILVYDDPNFVNGELDLQDLVYYIGRGWYEIFPLNYQAAVLTTIS